MIEDAFVPDYRVLAWMDLIAQRCPGRAVNTGPLYRMPWAAMFGTAVAAPMMGIGYGALDHYVRSQQPKPDSDAGTTRPVMGDWVILRGDRRGLERARRRSASCCSATSSRCTSTRAPMPPIPSELRQRCRRDQIMAGVRALRATEAVFEHAGGRALGSSNALQRMWRDVHGARAHVVNSPNMGARRVRHGHARRRELRHDGQLTTRAGGIAAVGPFATGNCTDRSTELWTSVMRGKRGHFVE